MLAANSADAVLAATRSSFDLEHVTLRGYGPVGVKADVAGTARVGTRLHHAEVDHVKCHLLGGRASDVCTRIYPTLSR